MTDTQRASLGMTLAGKNQFRVLSAIMTNFSHATEATQTALNSQGSAMQENSKYMESIEAKTAGFNAALQELSQTVVSNDLVGGIISLGTGFLQFVNTDFGGAAIRIGLLTTALTGLFGVLKAGSYFGVFGKGISAFISSISIGKIALIVGALAGLVEIIKLVDESVQRTRESKKFENIAKDVEKSKEKIEDFNSKIAETKKTLDDLKDTPIGDRTSDIDFEIGKLELLIEQYEKLKQKEQDAINTTYLSKFRESGIEDGSFKFTTTGAGEYTYIYSENQRKALADDYKSIGEAVISIADAFDIVIEESDTVDTILDKLSVYGVVMTKGTKTATEVVNESLPAFSRYLSYLDTYYQQSDEVIKQSGDFLKEQKQYYDILSSVDWEYLTRGEQQFVQDYEKLQTLFTRQSLGVDNVNAAKDALTELFNSVTTEDQGIDSLNLQEYVNALSEVEGISSTNLADMLNYLQEIGFIDLEYTDEQLQEIINKTFRLDGTDVDVEFDAETEAIDDALGAVQELAAQGVSVAGTTDAQALIDAIEVLKSQIAQLNAQHITINISTNIDDVLDSTSDLRKSLNNLPSPDISITGNVSEVAGILSNIISLSGRTVKINIDLRDANTGRPINPSQLQGIGHSATGSNYFGGGPVLINDGAPVNGSAGELVVADGQAQIYNDGKPTVVNLPRGAKIYTAAETQEILKNSGAVGGVPAFASGTQPSNVNYSNIAYTPSQYYSSTYVKGVSPKKTEESFEKWLKKRKHLLELDKITEEQYYLDLEYMNEKYLSKVTSAQDTYWKYQEQVYKWKKGQIDSENEALEKQIELQEALGNLEKAKSQKILIYKDGKFQYIADPDAIASAQRSVDSLLAKGYANGTLSATGGLRMVGENGPELRVLRSGDGIIPADATKNLLDMAKMGVGGLMGSLEKAAQTFYSFAIDNLSLPNATDAKGLLDGLKNYAYQYSYAK